jgi:hypothetical protein
MDLQAITVDIVPVVVITEETLIVPVPTGELIEVKDLEFRIS